MTKCCLLIVVLLYRSSCTSICHASNDVRSELSATKSKAAETEAYYLRQLREAKEHERRAVESLEFMRQEQCALQDISPSHITELYNDMETKSDKLMHVERTNAALQQQCDALQQEKVSLLSPCPCIGVVCRACSAADDQS